MNAIVEKIPVWALGWLLNGDSSNLSESDMKVIDGWLADNLCLHVSPPSDDAMPYFTSTPAFGLPCEVHDCECLMYK